MRSRSVFVAIACLALCSTAGYGLNMLETAGPIGAQQVGVTFGFGVGLTDLSGTGVWYLAPQGRLTIGLHDRLDLGAQFGWRTEVGGTGVQWLGTIVDVKVASIHVPDMYTLAWGAGGGVGLDLLGEGWGVFGQVLFESHSPLLPIFGTYRLVLPFDDVISGSLAFEGYIAAGLRVRLAPIARLLLVVDIYSGLASIGLGLEIAF